MTEFTAATICFAGTHDPRFTRTSILEEGLQRRGYALQHCVVPAWGSTADRVGTARRGLRNPSLLWRLGWAYQRVLRQLHALRPRPDALLLAHPGQLDAIVFRALAPRIPIVLDAFIALDETLADRGLASPASPSRRLARLLDRIALRTANLVVVDTAAHARRFAADYGLDLSKTVVVPVGSFDVGDGDWGLGVGERAQHSISLSPTHQLPTPRALRVLYFGGFIPLHGVPVVLEAARRIEPDEGIHIDLVGEGQQAQDAADFLTHVPLPHVKLHRGWMTEAELVERHVSCADVCLGVFAATLKAMDVVPAKIYLALACGRGVLTADTPAVREELLARAPGDDPVALCRPGDPDALAAALRGLRDDPDRLRRTAAAGRRLYETHFRPEQVVAPLAEAIDRLAAR